MKTELSLYNNNYFGSSPLKRKVDHYGTSLDKAKVKHNDKEHAYKIGTREYNNVNRPTESVSFSGSAVSGAGKAARKIPEWAMKLAQNQKFNKALAFAEENESKLSAIMSLGLAGVLKPFVVLLMPGAEEKDKQVTATKNALSAFIGYGLSCAILDPISSGVNKFINNPEKYLGKDNALVKEFAKNKAEDFVIRSKEELKAMKYKSNTLNSFKSCYKKGLGIIVAPLKAALTIAIMPYILKFLFGERNKNKDQERANKMPIYMEPLTNPNYAAQNTDNIFQNAFVPANKFNAAFPSGGNQNQVLAQNQSNFANGNPAKNQYRVIETRYQTNGAQKPVNIKNQNKFTDVFAQKAVGGAA